MPKALTFDVHFDAPITEVWRVVSDTDLVDAAAGMPAINYRDEPQPDGTSRRFCSYRKLVSFEYEELPFTWIHEQRYEVNRVYSKGPFSTFRHLCEIIPDDPRNPDAGCTVRTTFEFEPSGVFGVFATSGTRNDGVKPYQRVFSEAAQRLREKTRRERAHSAILYRPVDLTEQPRPTGADAARVREYAERTRKLFDSPLIDKLSEAIVRQPDDKLRRMQPRAYAAKWRADPGETLNLFLAATRAGMLKMRWDVICPHCRGDKMNLASLTEVRERAFCPACNVDFDVDLDRSLEAVFTPHPQVREVVEAHYCLGGPGTTPHIVYQRQLMPGQEHAFRIRLAQGRYRARFTGSKEYRWIDVGAGPAAQVAFMITDGAIEGADQSAPAGQLFDVRVRNDSKRTVLVVFESVEWARDALPAGELVADQRFRDLFSSEVLAPGIKLAVEDATILFTDVVGSTAMYNTMGDARAFALVRTHFDVLHEIVEKFHGAIVKTIGDAIMAVFTKPENAIAAASELHARTDEYVRQHGHNEGVQLKIGLHGGPCIAVTLNERLDYFGTTVNLAARVQGMSQGGDIMVTSQLAERTDNCARLREQGWQSQPEQAQAKGFDQPVPVLRWTRP
ncbi:MAG: adenylate/guanylate cyclase domain-containing protein [Planctomycetes bacterium]|nr:adenylate/guanylate cyclase domain-containing protein [Planctomycetota bacterium]MCW8134224.1 adenylate/guanylate cyclase domain-containing protein [Planctomycetota bacterium]